MQEIVRIIYRILQISQRYSKIIYEKVWNYSSDLFRKTKVYKYLYNRHINYKKIKRMLGIPFQELTNQET